MQKSWFAAKKAYENWIDKKIPYRHPKHTYDCLPAALADDLGLVRLAMVFSVGLGEILNWRLDERILKWSENLIRVFGLGLRWEYYAGFVRGHPLPHPNRGSNSDGVTDGKKKWQVIAGRLFFQDILSLVTHDSLDENGRKYYCDMARMLLTSIWARLGNRSDHVDPGRKEIYLKVFSFGYVFQTSGTPYLSAGPNDMSTVAQVGVFIPPSYRQKQMGFNNYSLKCCFEGKVLDQRHDYFSLAWDKRLDTPNARFKDLAYTYFSICQKKWVVLDVTTPNTFADSGMWCREHSGFHLPETDKEESDLVWQTYQTNWRQLPVPDQ